MSIDIIDCKKGEHFVLENFYKLPFEVLDVHPQLRYLLLFVQGKAAGGENLCCSSVVRH